MKKELGREQDCGHIGRVFLHALLQNLASFIQNLRDFTVDVTPPDTHTYKVM